MTITSRRTSCGSCGMLSTSCTEKAMPTSGRREPAGAQRGDRAVVVALAVAEAGPGPVEADERARSSCRDRRAAPSRPGPWCRSRRGPAAGPARGAGRRARARAGRRAGRRWRRERGRRRRWRRDRPRSASRHRRRATRGAAAATIGIDAGGDRGRGRRAKISIGGVPLAERLIPEFGFRRQGGRNRAG